MNKKFEVKYYIDGVETEYKEWKSKKKKEKKQRNAPPLPPPPPIRVINYDRGELPSNPTNNRNGVENGY